MKFNFPTPASIALLIFAAVATLNLCNCSKADNVEPPLEIKFKIDDESLNGWVTRRATLDELVQQYGEPAFLYDRPNGEQSAGFLLGIHHVEFLPPHTGRVGFTAFLRGGRMVRWSESTRY